MIKRASSSLNLEKEVSKKLFTQKSRNDPQRTERDPITQNGISEKDIELPSEIKPRGPAKGLFSVKGQGSFKFDSLPFSSSFTPTNKRAECIPINRNPITQDHPSLNPTKCAPNKEKYSKVRDSTVFNSYSEVNIAKPRKNQ